MADDIEDQWLYGDSNPDKSSDATEENLYGDKFENPLDSNATKQLAQPLQPPIIEPPKNFNSIENSGQEKENADAREERNLSGDRNKEESERRNEEEREEGEDGELDDINKDEAALEAGDSAQRLDGDEDDDEDDDSEDDVNVVIGEIKTNAQYTIKRGGLLTAVPQLKQPGKFSIEEFETIGTINGIPAHDFSLDSLEDKPWRKPGADITDYFNYGFNEETWRGYCERQKRMRVQESGVGLGQLSGATAQSINQAAVLRGNIPVTIVNDNSKYTTAPPGITPQIAAQRKAGPPPGRRVGGAIDVLGNANLNSRGDSPPKGNIIQVMTADRREYSRKTGFPDMSIPPPTIPPPGFAPPEAFGADYGVEYYNSDMDPYYQAYEPTQDSQWANSGWEHDEVKIMPPVYPPPVTAPSTHVLTSETSNQDSQDATTDKSNSALPGGVTIKQERDNSKERDRDRDRERDRDRSERDRERSERHRERSHRHRSRSRSTERRSRKHKSRSRSPGHRSHKKKKSKKSDRSKDDSD